MRSKTQRVTPGDTFPKTFLYAWVWGKFTETRHLVSPVAKLVPRMNQLWPGQHVARVDAASLGMTTAILERSFLATGPSNPLQGLDLIGNNEVAKVFNVSPSVVSMRSHRGTFAVAPAVITADGRRYWRREEVLRAAELLGAAKS